MATTGTLFDGIFFDLSMHGIKGFAGGDGKDLVVLENRADRLIVGGGDGIDTVNLNGNGGSGHFVGDWIGVEYISGTTSDDRIDATGLSEWIVLPGDRGADTLIGGDGADKLMSGSGTDILDAAAGNDTVTNGEDSDVFVFRKGTGHDVITDFTPGEDRLDLSGFSDIGTLQVARTGADTVITAANAPGDMITLLNLMAREIAQNTTLTDCANTLF